MLVNFVDCSLGKLVEMQNPCLWYSFSMYKMRIKVGGEH